MALDLSNLFVCRRFIPVTRNEKCHCSLMSLIPFFDYTDPLRRSELVSIVARGSLKSLKCYMHENRAMRIVDRHGNSPLHLAIIFKKKEVFDVLLETDSVKVNAVNRYGHTCLHLAVISGSEHFTSELVRRGADLNAVDESNCTPLHAAATRLTSKICRILVEGGADMNAQNLLGKTPIYHACQYGTMETVYMLLYYGADVTITDRYGVLPITVAMQQTLDCGGALLPSHRELHEVLFNYTFKKEKMDLNITTLTVAIKINSPLFPLILKKVDEVKYCRNDLMDFSRNACVMDHAYFTMFMNKFGYVIRDMFQNSSNLFYKITVSEDADSMVGKLMQFLTVLFKCKRNLKFLNATTGFSGFILILVNLHKDKKLSMKSLTDMVCFLYSYGLTCELNHLITIYETCGYCELFKLLLHMDIYVTPEQPKSLMPYLICDVHMTIDKLLNYVTRPNKAYRSTLKFFSDQKVKNFFAEDAEVKKQIEELPAVPTLLELSRNVARKHIIKRFRVKTTRDFYTLVKRIPIHEIYKKIITYEKELYPFHA